MYYERFFKKVDAVRILSLLFPTICSLPILLFKILAVIRLIMLDTLLFLLGSVMFIDQEP